MTFNVEIETEINMSEEEFDKLPLHEQEKEIRDNTDFYSQVQWLGHEHWKERLDNVDIQESWTVDMNTGLPPEEDTK